MNRDNDPALLFLPMGFFLAGCGILMALVHSPRTPEFVLSVCSGLMGVFLVVGTLLLRQRERD